MGGNIEKTFFELMKAGLFPNFAEKETACCPILRDEDWGEVYRMAEEQAVTGLVAEGIGWLKGHDSIFRIPQEWALRFIGQAMLIEQRNKAMNAFVAELVEGLRKRRVETLLMKGQGIAQCYEKPLWRTSGDVDLLLKGHDYTMAKFFLLPKSNRNNPERKYSKELGLSMGQWCVELHGTQRTGLSSRLDKKIDDLQRCAFNKMEDRLWMNGETRVFLPSVDEDVLLVFTHFLKHFYKGEGANLRQICDLCRLLWSYRNKIDLCLLKSRLEELHLMTEWKVFCAIAVKYLGMPKDAIPFYFESNSTNKKASKLVEMIMYRKPNGRMKAACLSMMIFPVKTLLFLLGIMLDVNWLKMRELLFWETDV